MKNIKLDTSNMIMEPLPLTQLDGFESKLKKTKTKKNLKLLLESYIGKEIIEVEEQNYIKHEIFHVLFKGVPSNSIFGKTSIMTLNAILEDCHIPYVINEVFEEFEDCNYYVFWEIISTKENRKNDYFNTNLQPTKNPPRYLYYGRWCEQIIWWR